MRREAPWATYLGRQTGAFSTEFKRTTVPRIVTGEKTVAELSRELDIAPSVIRNWKRFAEVGATTLKAPHAVQWLSDNGPQDTATACVLYVHEVGLVPITTPRTARRATAWPRRS